MSIKFKSNGMLWLSRLCGSTCVLLHRVGKLWYSESIPTLRSPGSSLLCVYCYSCHNRSNRCKGNNISNKHHAFKLIVNINNSQILQCHDVSRVSHYVVKIIKKYQFCKKLWLSNSFILCNPMLSNLIRYSVFKLLSWHVQFSTKILDSEHV